MTGKKSKLNQRQWLNIIIISISAMFLLMVVAGKMLQRATGELSDNIGQTAQIEKIDFGLMTIRRENKNWQATGESELSDKEVEMILKNWHTLLSRPAEEAKEMRDTGRTILIYLEGLASPIVVKVRYQAREYIFYFVSLNQEIRVKEEKREEYFPPNYSI